MENRPLTSIRGIAALWVVALHITDSSVSSNKAISMGYAAVDLFFILSGLILSGVYSNIDPRSIGRFWIKRVCRVYPAHVVSLLLLTIIVFVPLGDHALSNAILNMPYAGSALLLQPYLNLEAAANPVAWSVGIELGCYLLFPVAIICIRRMRPLGPAAISTLIMFLALEWGVCSHFRGAIHGVPAMSRGVAGFGLGMMIWRVSSGCTIKGFRASIIEGSAFLGVLYSIAANRPELIPLWSAMLLFGISYDAGFFAKILRSQLLFWLGSISFSVYLLHYPMMLIVNKWLPIRPELTVEEPIRLFAILTLTLSASTISYWLVEKPGRKIPTLFGKRRVIVLSDPMRPAPAGLAGSTSPIGIKTELDLSTKEGRA